MRRQLVGRGIACLLVLSVLSAADGAGSRTTEVTVERARALLAEKSGRAGLVLLDVRTPEEYAQGHLKGAMNLNVASPEFVDRLGRLDRARTYLVYCRTGNRSTQAVRMMERLGFKSILHMGEGIVGWQRSRLPLVRS